MLSVEREPLLVKTPHTGHVPADTLDIALLGLGRVGCALMRRCQDIASRRGVTPRIVSALVRDPGRPRPVRLDSAVVTSDPEALFARRPDVLVEVLGGVEPAFGLVTRALALGIPVVTANKSLLAARGAELEAAAARAGVPLLYEASVLAGVPLLGMLARRAEARLTATIEGIVNGTSNFILGRLADGAGFAGALEEAQRLGLAEPDPASDVGGADAAEKLAVLVGHLRWGRMSPDAIETVGIEAIEPADLAAARDFGGSIKPVVVATREAAVVRAFSGPAFVPASHRLARAAGVENALVLGGSYGPLAYAGPGAGPDATAATLLDDVFEAVGGGAYPDTLPLPPVATAAPETGWFVRLTAARLPACEEIADLLSAHGVWLRRSSRQGDRSYLLTHSTSRERITGALDALGRAAGVGVAAVRTLEG